MSNNTKRGMTLTTPDGLGELHLDAKSVDAPGKMLERDPKGGKVLVEGISMMMQRLGESAARKPE